MIVTLETQFSETGQDAPWKNDVAKELNAILDRERHIIMEFCGPKTKQASAGTLSIVQRVAEFEEITVLKGEE